jgi:hypothetical protein
MLGVARQGGVKRPCTASFCRCPELLLLLLLAMACRAGRDGQPAECVLMFSGADVNRLQYMTRMCECKFQQQLVGLGSAGARTLWHWLPTI